MVAVLARLLKGLRLWHVFLLVISIKAALLAIDPKPRVFLGDSASYLYTALYDWVPDQRSYTYGAFIGIVTGASQSLRNLIWSQTCLMTGAALCVVIVLRRYLSAPVWLAGLAGVLCAVEPIQLMAERFVLSEPPALFCFAVYATLAFRYLKRGDVLSLLLMPLPAVAAVSFRVAFLPCILFTAFAVPFMSRRARRLYRYLSNRKAPSGFDPVAAVILIAAHFALSAGITILDLNLYKAWYGEISNGPPAYIQDDGFFLLCDVTPILRAGDFPDREMGQRVLDKVTLDIKDPKNRAAQMFMAGGLVQTLIRELAPGGRREDRIFAGQIARYVALSAIRHRPLAMAKLIWVNVGLYFDRQNLLSAVKYDEYLDWPIDRGTQELLAKFGFYGTRQPPAGPVVWWHFASWPWYMFLIAFPPLYAIAVLATGAWRKPQFILLVAYSAIFLGLAVVITFQATPRFEMPLAWLFPLAVGALVIRPARALLREPDNAVTGGDTGLALEPPAVASSPPDAAPGH